MKRKFSKIKIISGPFQPLRKLQLDEGSPNLPSPPPSLRNRAICNPPVNRPVAELHASASLEVRPPCIFISQAGLKRKPSNHVLQPLLSLLLWTLNQIPNVPLEFPIHARRNFLPVPQIQRDKDVMQLQTAKPFVLPSSLSFTMLERGTTMELVK